MCRQDAPCWPFGMLRDLCLAVLAGCTTHLGKWIYASMHIQSSNLHESSCTRTFCAYSSLAPATTTANSCQTSCKEEHGVRQEHLLEMVRQGHCLLGSCLDMLPRRDCSRFSRMYGRQCTLLHGGQGIACDCLDCSIAAERILS